MSIARLYLSREGPISAPDVEPSGSYVHDPTSPDTRSNNLLRLLPHVLCLTRDFTGHGLDRVGPGLAALERFLVQPDACDLRGANEEEAEVHGGETRVSVSLRSGTGWNGEEGKRMCTERRGRRVGGGF